MRVANLSISILFPALLAPSAPDANLHRAIRAAPYRIEPTRGGYAAENAGQRLRARFTEGRAEFRFEARRFSLALIGAGEVKRTSMHENRIEFERVGSTEWYVNEPGGIEQGFTVARRRGRGPLELTLQVTGDLLPSLDDGNVVLRAGDRTLLRYGDLESRDAGGRLLPSRMVLEGQTIRLEVDDSLARYPVTVDPVVQQQVLAASDASQNSEFGSAVSIDGNTAVVGACGAGKAYIFTQSTGVWTQQAELSASNSSNFGCAVAVSGGTVAVGAFTSANEAGAVYVYTAAGTYQQTINAPSGALYFGASVAMSGATLVVGAPYSGSGEVGAAYVFAQSGGVWSLQAELTDITGRVRPGGEYGAAVAVSGGTAVVGMPQPTNAIFVGTAFFFTQSGTQWSEQTAFSASQGGDQFGSTLALNGGTLVVGAPLNGTNATGAAYVFTQSGGFWSQAATLTAPDPSNYAQFGTSVAVNGGAAIIGAGQSGKAYVFMQVGNTWSQQAELSPASSQFGSSAALSGATALIGAQGGDGAVYVYQLSDVTLDSVPSGLSFSLAGAGCNGTGTFTTPYTGFWSACQVTWPSPQGGVITQKQNVFEGWFDGVTGNQRTVTLPGLAETLTYSADFQTQYYLMVSAAPFNAGTISGAGFYPAGDAAAVAATPKPGYVFTGFSGALGGATTPQNLVMSGPETVTANFAPTPQAPLEGNITSKSGTANQRVWTIAVTNNGPGIAYNAQAFGLMLTQTYGATCAPVRLAPGAFPVALGQIAAGATAAFTVTLNFSSCPANARFTASIGAMSGGGSSVGLLQLVNQTP